MNSFSNSTKVWLFLTLCAFATMLISFEGYGRVGLWVSFTFVGLGFLLMAFWGECPLVDAVNAEPFQGTDPWGLQPMLQKQAELIQVPTPQLYISKTHRPFAFAICGRDEKGLVCLSTGLLQRLSTTECAAVVAQLVCHQNRLSSLRIEMIQVLAFTMVGLGRFLDQIVFRGKTQFCSRALSPVGEILLKIFVSKELFFRNDIMASEIVGDRHPLANALWKMQEIGQSQPLKIPPCTSHFFIVSPARQKDYLVVHPKIDLRIKKLIGYFPL